MALALRILLADHFDADAWMADSFKLQANSQLLGAMQDMRASIQARPFASRPRDSRDARVERNTRVTAAGLQSGSFLPLAQAGHFPMHRQKFH